jgi:hypothetical protein
MLSEPEARSIAEAFLLESRQPTEPELAIDWERVRMKDGILIAPYNSAEFLTSGRSDHRLLDCWPILVDLSSGDVRFGTLEERSFWKNS